MVNCFLIDIIQLRILFLLFAFVYLRNVSYFYSRFFYHNFN